MLAERIAREAHASQVDRGGKPYILHVEGVVAFLLERWPDATQDEIDAAWLHDVLEDTPWTADALRAAGVRDTAIGIVVELTRPEGITYRQWIKTLASTGSISAVRVKIADNKHNSLAERVAAIPEGPEMLRKRYLPAKALLEERLAS